MIASGSHAATINNSVVYDLNNLSLSGTNYIGYDNPIATTAFSLEVGDTLVTNLTFNAGQSITFFANQLQSLTTFYKGDVYSGGNMTSTDNVTFNTTMGEYSFTGSNKSGVLAQGYYLNNAFLEEMTVTSMIITSTIDQLGTVATFNKFGIWAIGAAGVDINITQTPIPGAIWLMGSGLLGLMGVSRKKKHQAVVT